MATGRYNILLVENSDAEADRVREALAPMGLYHVVSHLLDALAARDYLRRPRDPASRKQSPALDIVLLNLNAPNCEHIEFLQWARRPVLRPVLAVFSAENHEENRKLAELLQADLYKPNVWQPHVFLAGSCTLSVISPRPGAGKNLDARHAGLRGPRSSA